MYAKFKYCLISTFKAAITEKLFEELDVVFYQLSGGASNFFWRLL